MISQLFPGSKTKKIEKRQYILFKCIKIVIVDSEITGESLNKKKSYLNKTYFFGTLGYRAVCPAGTPAHLWKEHKELFPGCLC